MLIFSIFKVLIIIFMVIMKMTEVEMASFLGEQIPKTPTQQPMFLKKYPEYDGRGTKIAILDTGVDPSNPGLQKTTDGKPKLIECMDLTGAGDVNTSTIKRADENGILIGLTERELKIPKTWKNPSGYWHLGTKALHEIYSYKIKERINKETTEKFKKKNKIAIAEVMKELREHEKKVGTKSKKISDKEDREEINAKLEYLKEAENHPIESPTVDCIVYFDGEKWKACLDTTLTGDLENAKVISSFCENQEYGILSDKCLVSYCFNIHDDGNLLEICVTQNSHGTHVAHIAAGHFPDNPEKDGLAPGAQIISLCIGDSRKQACLTEQALLRALNKCIQFKVNVVNFSFEASQNCTGTGTIAKLLTKMVEQYRIIFVAAAGNNGPGFGTMGFASGRLHHSAIYVGAYLTAEMKKAIYGEYKPLTSTVFPFSSRGPCLDGTLGVCVSAPGAAIAGVPKHNLTSSELMAGTSMSAPNAAGNIACLISAMKSESIPISPFRIKLGLMNSAKMPEDGSYHPFSLGAGIIQICSAFELIKSAMNFIPANLTDCKISVNGKRGIYLRDSWEINEIKNFKVELVTDFNSSEGIGNMFKFSHVVELKQSKGAVGYISYPSQCRIPSSSICDISIDPRRLVAGKEHYFEISGIVKNNESLGSIFRIPITVIIPEEVTLDSQYCCKKRLTLEAAFTQRLFLKAPMGSTYATVTIKLTKCDSEIKIDVQQVCNSSTQTQQQKYNLCLSPNKKEKINFLTPEGATVELNITQECNSRIKSPEIQMKVKFYGFSVHPLILSSNNPVNIIHFTNKLRSREIDPVIELSEFCQPLNPSYSSIESMKERDIIDGTPSFCLLIMYNFCAEKSGNYKFEHEGYDNYKICVDCFLLQVSTSTKRYIATCLNAQTIFLEKGYYIIRVQYRHIDNNVLERLQHASLLVTKFIPKIFPVIFSDAVSAFNRQENRFPRKLYSTGESGEFYMDQIPCFPAYYPSGSYFKGYIYLQSSDYFSRVGITYSLSDAFLVQTDNNNNSLSNYNQDFIGNPQTEPHTQQLSSFRLLFNAVEIALEKNDIIFLAMFVKYFMKNERALTDFSLLKTALYNLVNELLNEHLKNANEYFELYQNGPEQKNRDVEGRQNSFDSSISMIDDYNIVAVFAKQLILNMKNGDENPISISIIGSNYNYENSDDPMQQPYATNMHVTPDTYDAPYDYKICKTEKNNFDYAKLEKVYQNYMMLTDSITEDARIIQAKYSVAHKRYCTALSHLTKIIADKTTNSDYLYVEKEIIELLKKLGWNHLAEEAQKALLIKHQKFYRPF